MAAVIFPMPPPPTTNTLSPAQKSRLQRSFNKLGRLLGSTPFLMDDESQGQAALRVSLDTALFHVGAAAHHYHDRSPSPLSTSTSPRSATPSSLLSYGSGYTSTSATTAAPSLSPSSFSSSSSTCLLASSHPYATTSSPLSAVSPHSSSSPSLLQPYPARPSSDSTRTSSSISRRAVTPSPTPTDPLATYRTHNPVHRPPLLRLAQRGSMAMNDPTKRTREDIRVHSPPAHHSVAPALSPVLASPAPDARGYYGVRRRHPYGRADDDDEEEEEEEDDEEVPFYFGGFGGEEDVVDYGQVLVVDDVADEEGEEDEEDSDLDDDDTTQELDHTITSPMTENRLKLARIAKRLGSGVPPELVISPPPRSSSLSDSFPSPSASTPKFVSTPSRRSDSLQLPTPYSPPPFSTYTPSPLSATFTSKSGHSRSKSSLPFTTSTVGRFPSPPSSPRARHNFATASSANVVIVGPQCGGDSGKGGDDGGATTEERRKSWIGKWNRRDFDAVNAGLRSLRRF